MKNCPSCKSNEAKIRFRLSSAPDAGQIECLNCGLEGPWGATQEQASDLWDDMPRQSDVETATAGLNEKLEKAEKSALHFKVLYDCLKADQDPSKLLNRSLIAAFAERDSAQAVSKVRKDALESAVHCLGVAGEHIKYFADSRGMQNFGQWESLRIGTVNKVNAAINAAPSPWIPISVSKPPDSNLEYWFAAIYDKKRYVYTSRPNDGDQFVTHWMPVHGKPAPPEEI